MYPPIMETLAADGDVTALLGTNPVRCYPFGEAPQNGPYPYLVWQIITGLPENYLGQRPDIDAFSIQVDIYGSTAATVRAVALAVIDAIEPLAYVARWGQESRDQATKVYRKSFDVSWHVERNPPSS
jgi:hypothetical protein